MVRGAEELDAGAPGRVLAAGLVDGEVEVPELELGFARGADGGEDDVAAARRPADGVGRAPGERAEELEVALGALVLVEGHVRLDRDAWPWVADVRVAA